MVVELYCDPSMDVKRMRSLWRLGQLEPNFPPLLTYIIKAEVIEKANVDMRDTQHQFSIESQVFLCPRH